MIDGVEALKGSPVTIGGLQVLSRGSLKELHILDVKKAKKKRKKGADKANEILKGGGL